MQITLPEGMEPGMCQYLEEVRNSGVTNMFGAAPYLAEAYSLDRRKASTYLCFWMEHYAELQEAGLIVRR